jgi:hypothetical protein
MTDEIKSMRVETIQLRTIVEILFDHLEEAKITSVEIPPDFYWNIPKESKYDSYAEPSQFSIGQLTDDWQELKKLLEAKHKPLGYDFVWLASILRVIGENLLT